jgi:hypothetical protein
VGAAAATGAASSATSSVGASLGALSLMKWLAVGMTAGVVAAGGAAVVRHEVARGQVAVPRVADAGKAAPGGSKAPNAGKTGVNGGLSQPNGESMLPHVAAEPNGVSAPRLGAPAPMPPAGTERAAVSDSASLGPPPTPIPAPTPTPASGALAREVAQIDAARSALASGDPTRALAEVERYERTRETPTFVREALLLRIEAFSARGERARASELARRYLERFPDDAHVAKLRQEFAL